MSLNQAGGNASGFRDKPDKRPTIGMELGVSINRHVIEPWLDQLTSLIRETIRAEISAIQGVVQEAMNTLSPNQS